MNEKQSNCCCSGSGQEAGINPAHQTGPKWKIGVLETSVGAVPRVSTRLGWSDIIGNWRARWGMGRMNYQIPPGLYAAGNPDSDSVVLVSANYKMSFDRLRKELTGINAWILVINTRGINVWCAAGKGTFGTAELVYRVAIVDLPEVVSHRTLILPQLGAVGVAAHEVLKQSGFKVGYGPVRARDLPAFLQAGQNSTPEMRQVRFGFWDRLFLTPAELTGIIKPALIWFAVLFGLGLIGNRNASFLGLLGKTFAGFIPFLGAIFIGTVLVPALLPYIPGRAFAWKGWLVGLLWAALYIRLSPSITWVQTLTCLLLVPAIASFLAMNFTGASTYTSLSGVVREMKIALPAIIISAGLGLVLSVINVFIKF
jgi:hypothetical protein